MKISSFT
jgi:hypothetical protein